MGTDAFTKMEPEYAADPDSKGNDETLETRTLAILPVGIAGVNEVLRVHVVPG